MSIYEHAIASYAYFKKIELQQSKYWNKLSVTLF